MTTGKSEKPKRPLSFIIAKWYGYVFAATYTLYGGVSLILGFMDHTYEDTGKSLVFLILGLVLLTVVWAYRDLKAWGWYGMVVINGLAVLGFLFNLSDTAGLSVLVLSAGALILLFLPTTRDCIFRRT
jgi:hypothetical protein